RRAPVEILPAEPGAVFPSLAPDVADGTADEQIDPTLAPRDAAGIRHGATRRSSGLPGPIPEVRSIAAVLRAGALPDVPVRAEHEDVGSSGRHRHDQRRADRERAHPRGRNGLLLAVR